MDIVISEEQTGRTVITLSGRLDTITAPELEQSVKKILDAGKTNLLIDLAEIDFVSSAGLRVIIGTQKKLMCTGSLVFRNVQPDVMSVFDMTGFSKLMNFE